MIMCNLSTKLFLKCWNKVNSLIILSVLNLSEYYFKNNFTVNLR